MKTMEHHFGVKICILLVLLTSVWGGSKMRLEEVKVLTLHAGKMTTARRSQAVPQLNCIGGSAGCSAFRPQVVQCYNQGSDGYDIQWECKTDMDNAYRFGKVEVTCEGYEYADDEYVLRGSCGLEYTLDLTKEGYSQKQSNQHDYYGNQNSYQSYSYQSKKHSSGFGDVIMIGIIVLIVYAIYKTCLTSQPQHQYSSTSSDYPSDDSNYRNQGYGGGGWFNNFFGNTGYGNNGGYGAARPPPYGFHQEHYNAGCAGAQPPPNRGSNFGGFWSGAATGGILGYMFGNRNQGASYARRTHQPHSSWTAYDSHAAFGGTSNSSSSSGSSSGTRTASGFGGTRRR